MGDIEKLFMYVCDELDGAEKYALYASKKKAMGQGMLAGIATKVATIELDHARMFYDAIQQLIKEERMEYTNANKEIPKCFEERIKTMAECYTKTMAEVMYMIEMNK